jgi:hypothetical protein
MIKDSRIFGVMANLILCSRTLSEMERQSFTVKKRMQVPQFDITTMLR